MARLEHGDGTAGETDTLAKRTWLICSIILLMMGFAGIVFVTREVLLLILLAVLFAVGLCRLANMIPDSKWLPHPARTGLVLAGLGILSTIFVASFGLQLEQQYQKANIQIAKSLTIFGEGLENHPSLKQLLGFGSIDKKTGNTTVTSDDPKNQKADASSSNNNTSVLPDEQSEDSAPPTTRPDDEALNSKVERSNTGSVAQMMDLAENHLASSGISSLDGFSRKLYSGLSTFFSTTFGFLVNLFFVLFIGTMIAVNPSTYRNGFMALVPAKFGETTAGMLSELHETIWHWMIGRLATMVLTGAGTGLVLALIGVPSSFLLGFLTALLTFIPNIGAIAALVLAILFAAPLGTGSVIAVIVAYGIVQFVESNILTPLIMQQQVAVPPALLISFQFVMAAAFGILGVMVSEPVIAILLVVVRHLYIGNRDDENPVQDPNATN